MPSWLDTYPANHGEGAPDYRTGTRRASRSVAQRRSEEPDLRSSTTRRGTSRRSDGRVILAIDPLTSLFGSPTPKRYAKPGHFRSISTDMTPSPN